MTPTHGQPALRKSHKKTVSWNFPEPTCPDTASMPAAVAAHHDSDSDSDSEDEDESEYEEQPTLTKLNTNVLPEKVFTPPLSPSPGSHLSELKIPLSSSNRPRDREPLPEYMSPAGRCRQHQANYSTSSMSSTSTTSSHQPILNLNLPPFSPSQPSAPRSPSYKSYRSQSPVFKSHRHMSSISSTSSQLSNSKFVFPPPAPVEIDFSFSFSPPVSLSDDGSQYSSEPQTDLQDIFVTLAHKERCLLEAREQMLAAEKDLQQFKQQWSSVLSGDEDSTMLTQEILQNSLASPRRAEPSSTASSIVSAVEPPAKSAYQNDNKQRHGKTSTSLSAPVSSCSSKRRGPLRHSIGHASELGLGLTGVENPITPLRDSKTNSDNSKNLLSQFSFFFREKLHGLFDFPEESAVASTPTKNPPVLSTPSSCSTTSTASMSSPASSMSPLTSSPLFLSSPYSKPFSPLIYSASESSFITRFFTAYGSSGSHLKQPLSKDPMDFLKSPTRQPRGLNILTGELARPRALSSISLSPPLSLCHPGPDPLHQQFAPLLSYKYHQ